MDGWWRFPCYLPPASLGSSSSSSPFPPSLIFSFYPIYITLVVKLSNHSIDRPSDIFNFELLLSRKRQLRESPQSTDLFFVVRQAVQHLLSKMSIVYKNKRNVWIEVTKESPFFVLSANWPTAECLQHLNKQKEEEEEDIVTSSFRWRCWLMSVPSSGSSLLRAGSTVKNLLLFSDTFAPVNCLSSFPPKKNCFPSLKNENFFGVVKVPWRGKFEMFHFSKRHCISRRLGIFVTRREAIRIQILKNNTGRNSQSLSLLLSIESLFLFFKFSREALVI